ncbi:hypothetical protein [Nocardia sp. AG03]|uniref:hypothetical protein n=1 Tax=Nocardia sp. AG03 TaxID=3025312 RepID=UPI0024189A23|nr:hypothetical protein [Nocardia sp. AG03]
MARTTFTGDLESPSHELVLDLVRAWLGRPELTMTLRRTGYETTFADDTIEVYCYEANGGGDSFFLIEGVVEADPAAAAQRLAGLATACRAAGLACSIDYAEADADGAAIGPESSIE